ncbi:hypothetical protein [Streptomyces sp. NPDC002402]
MGEAWTVGSTLAALLIAVAAFLVPHRRAQKAESEAAAVQARSAAGRASLVTASTPWSSSTTIEVVISNGAPTAIADVDLLSVRPAAAEPEGTWRLNPNISQNTAEACILQPGESLTSRVQLLGVGGVPVAFMPGMRIVITFGFRDADGQWWKRDIGQPPQRCETRPVA